jgi:dehydrogenase/reductase SDR family member 1
MKTLQDKVAVVTGASRGVGKGIALGLAEAGATVYVTGRTIEKGKGPEGLPGTIQETAAMVTAYGGRGVAIRCDHRNDAETEEAFQRVIKAEGRIDILVNAVWGGYERMVENGVSTWNKPFWHQPYWRWDGMFQAGVRAYYVASAIAARSMVEVDRGLIVNVSYWAGQKFMGNSAYGVAKAATDKLTAYMAWELREHGVAAVSLYPGLVRTENVMRNAAQFDLTNSESPQFSGRAVVGLASDPRLLDKSGRVFVAAALAEEYGFTDVDGKQPKPLSLPEV